MKYAFYGIAGMFLIAASLALYGNVQTFGGSQVGILPNHAKTPGAVNAAITQSNIQQNICNPSWSTKTIRPPSTYTTNLKKQQLSAGYALNGDTNTADYEEDHLISLELGGNPTDPKNLWPESYNTKPNARDKDKVENYLHSQVCSGKMTLKQAQDLIAKDWTKVKAPQTYGTADTVD